LANGIPEGVEELRRVTAENVGQPLALMFGSDVVGVPVIRRQLQGPRAQLSIPAASADQAERIWQIR
jgi:preprotein translocase subunit SecD